MKTQSLKTKFHKSSNQNKNKASKVRGFGTNKIAKIPKERRENIERPIERKYCEIACWRLHEFARTQNAQNSLDRILSSKLTK